MLALPSSDPVELARAPQGCGVPPVTFKETLTWVAVTPMTMPDVDQTVFVTIDITLEADDSEPVWLAWHDGEVWREVSGSQITGEVVSWCQMPAGFLPPAALRTRAA